MCTLLPDNGPAELGQETTHVLGNKRIGDMLNKVPEVTVIFWMIKIMSTTVGETGADYLAVHVGLGTTLTGLLMASLLVVAVVVQLSMNRYVPWIYWLTVVLVSVVGTQITDFLSDELEVSLYLSTAAFAVVLAATFASWYAVERTLSIHTIVTTRRELFYWAAILFTFALGTAAGDLATEALGLGFNVGVLA
ncbi:putative membrane-anchored protein, partial [Bradyrhizobium sp. F1.13.3]